MGLLDIFSGVSQLLPGIGQAAKDLRSAITGEISPDKKAELALKAQELENSVTLLQMQAEKSILDGQNEINKIEAASTNMFIAGARPAILWIGAIVILYNYVISPLLRAAGVSLPELAMNDLWPVVTGILGLGTMRTVEKVNNVVARH